MQLIYSRYYVNVMNPIQLALLPSVVALSLLAVKRGYLNKRGGIASVFVGWAVALSSVSLFILLSFFFVSSSLLTRARADYKREIGLKDVAGRSMGQVIGVGLPIAIFSIAHLALDDEASLLASAAAIATATADTWASEIGVAYGGIPRLITKPWQRIEPGNSGGITPVGILASAAGSTTVGVLASLFWGHAALLIALLGFLGEILDSVFGCTIQTRYICGGIPYDSPKCESPERRGFLPNEYVNSASELIIGVIAYLSYAQFLR